MDCRQNCCDESATDLPRSPAVLYPAQSVGLGHLGAFPEHLPLFGPGGSARGKARQVIVAGLLRTRRSNSGGDPSTTGDKNARECSRWCTVRRRFSKKCQQEGGHPVRS